MEVCSSQVVQTIPMNLLGRKSCSAMASTIFESHLHCTKMEAVLFYGSLTAVC